MQDSFDARIQGRSPIQNTKQKSSKGWMISTIILLLLVIGGGVFGGIVIFKGNRDTNRLSEVEAQLEEKEEKISELENKNDKQTVESGDMIRLGDTGIYLKYPTKIEDLSYTINIGWTDNFEAAITARFTGYDASDDSRQNKLEFADINNWALGTLNVYSKRDDYKSCEELEKEREGQHIDTCYRPYEDNKYYIEVVFPQNVVSEIESSKEIEINTTKIFMDWLTDSENYVVKR